VTRATASLLCLALLGVGCTVSPQPEPPPVIDISLLEIAPTPTDEAFLTGKPGAVRPGMSDLVILNLDDVAGDRDLVVAADGSFSVGLGVLGQFAELRLQAIAGALRSEPLDIGVDGTGLVLPAGVIPAPRPLEACLFLSPALELDAGSVAVGAQADASVELQNDCPDAVQIDALTLRGGDPAWSVTTAAPLSLAAGDATSIALRFAPVTAGASTEILFVELGDPEGRRPLTLRGDAQ
jgi:hypothetical protein